MGERERETKPLKLQPQSEFEMLRTWPKYSVSVHFNHTTFLQRQERDVQTISNLKALGDWVSPGIIISGCYRSCRKIRQLMSIWLGCYITLQCSAEDSLLSRGITLYFLPCSSTTNMSEQPDPVICPARKYGLWSGCNIPNAVTDETHNDDPAMFLQGFIYFLKGKKTPHCRQMHQDKC